MARGRGRVWIIGLIILAVLALFSFAQSTLFSVQKIVVQGNKVVSRDDLLALANIGTGANIFQVSTGAILKNVSLHPLVKSVNVDRELPGTLVINIVERKPVAMIPVPNGFAKVDDQGVFLQRCDTWPQEPLPIISGIELPANLNLGQPIANPGLREGIKTLLSLPGELYPQVGELYAGNQDKLVFYTRDGLEIRLGIADQAGQKFAVMQKFLADSTYKPYRVGYYVDLTTGKPVLGRRSN